MDWLDLAQDRDSGGVLRMSQRIFGLHSMRGIS
jgi:hypothetical protein